LKFNPKQAVGRNGGENISRATLKWAVRAQQWLLEKAKMGALVKR
jgi:hypothetical protein